MTERQWLRIAAAWRTIVEQYTIVRGLTDDLSSVSTIVREKLALMLSGAPTDVEDANPLARNTQFELFVASNLALGGVQVAFGEPDLRVLYYGKDVGVAVKRLTSPRNLCKRVLDGARQIRQREDDGFVAVNVDVVTRPVRHLDEPDVGVSAFQARLKPLYDITPQLLARRCLLGWMAFGTVTEWYMPPEGQPVLSMRLFRHFHELAKSVEDRTRFVIFFEEVIRRLDAWGAR